ncbi:MAG: hypothetical protein IJ696_06375 [Ruminococcus sp.]|nr:hypothetical protein [Ruminococcus sp.]
MSFIKKLFGLPDENDFDSRYQVRYNTEVEEPVVNTAINEDGFKFTVDQVFMVQDAGAVVTGVIESGTINRGEEITLDGQKTRAHYQVGGIESLRRLVDTASTGDNVGILLLGANKEALCHGDKIFR